ncbi:hypothetical protein CGZ80_06805 [Rhodopirellula sp. MGV]|nr:hypothetical protein CGZ80_06805 [Rhodopirellula sp. MGV]PNY36185.1 hypothetical protein C2E31_13775 [Rhodopirellula baltica]
MVQATDSLGKTGWLISRMRPRTEWQSSEQSASIIEYLQIATGQWGPAEIATWFPTESSANVYREDFQVRSSFRLLSVFLCMDVGQSSSSVGSGRGIFEQVAIPRFGCPGKFVAGFPAK